MTTAPRRRPNVVVFFTDQQRWDSVGAHGNKMGLTPNFDRLAASGMFVQNSFTCQPVCGPARSALQTGLYPTTTGCYKNGVPLPRVTTLADTFSAAGYRTGYIGKWHLSEHEPVPLEDRAGYDYWLAANLLEFTSGPFDTVVFDGDGRPVKLPGYRVDALTDAAIRYIDDNRDDPFFLFLSFLEPHHQNSSDSYPAPIGYEERLQGRLDIPEDLQQLGGSTLEHFAGYMGMVARLDEAFGRLIEALTSLGLMEDTIILFTSDHGCHFKTRNDEYKRSCHESSIRVPTLFHGPGFNGRGHYDGMASLIDLPPTLLDAAGLGIPAAMQGHSLLSDRLSDDVLVQISEHHVGRALRTRRWKYEIEAPEFDGYDVPGAKTYIEARLYDLETDPYELENLVAASATREIRTILAARLKERMADAGEPVPEIIAAENSEWNVRRAAAVPHRTILGNFAAD